MGIVDAIPVNLKMKFDEYKVASLPLGATSNYPWRYFHVHEVTWQSSNGDLNSLRGLATREKVDHRSDPWLPPFDQVVCGTIPRNFAQPTNPSFTAHFGSNKDDHSIGNPAIILADPRAPGSVIADQVYEYSADGVTWAPIPGAAYELEKGARASGGNLVFYFRKVSAPTNPNAYHFEVEYSIGTKVPAPSGFMQLKVGTPANIVDYASRVVSLR